MCCLKSVNFILISIAQTLSHAQHNFLLIFVKLHNFQRYPIAFLEIFIGTLKIVNTQLRDGHKSLNMAFEVNDHPAFENARNITFYCIAHRIGNGEFRPGIFNSLFVPQRDSPSLFVDIEHDNIQFLAFFYDLARMANALGPRHIGNMHQPINPLFDFDKSPKISQIAYTAANRCASGIFFVEIIPGIGLHLLETQRNFLTFLINAQDHNLNFIANGNQFGRMANMLRPRHFRNVYQPFDTLFQLDKSPVIRNADNLAYHLAINRISFLNIFPWMVL